MIADVPLPDVYRGQINFWVEDPLTREYLKECWQGAPEIFFLTGGGNEGITAVLADAERRGYRNVFGLIDRDFREPNSPDWLNKNKKSLRFIPEVHEFENYLLDPHALAGCSLNTGKRTVQWIEDRLQKRASELVWWMACRQVVTSIREGFVRDAFGHPKCEQVKDALSAERFIIDAPWFSAIATSTKTWMESGEVQTRLRKAYQEARADLECGRWTVTFSGKEIFHHIRDKIYEGGDDNPDRDVDMAKSIARWQVENRRVPAELLELRNALRQRVGLPLN